MEARPGGGRRAGAPQALAGGPHRRLAAVIARYERSWVSDVVEQLRILDAVEWTTVFGAELLWSALPLIILLSSLANERIDDDLSRHIGLNSDGAHIVRGLFRATPAHPVLTILAGLLVALVGVISVVGSLQLIYERAFEQGHRGWRETPRLLVWLVALLGSLIAEAMINPLVRDAVGPVVDAILDAALVTLFLAWTIHFLLAGRVAWRLVIRPALVTGLLWLVLSFGSSLYFSDAVTSDSRLYGTIGVAFTLLSWFILIGMVLVLGAAGGAVWQRRAAGRTARGDDRS